MNSEITAQKPVTSIRETFDTVAAGYDNQSLRFFQDSARRMAAYFDPRETRQVKRSPVGQKGEI